MGDRANVAIKQEHGEGMVYLYTHWGGEELPHDVRVALERGRDRWQDETYLARIIFDSMKGDDVNGATGFGIGTYRPDNEHPIIRIDCDLQRVAYEPTMYRKDDRSWSFEDYVTAPLDEVAFQ